MEEIFDTVVIGAGACGLMAAWELALTGKKVAIAEARNRIGGRIDTDADPRFHQPVERGAEFVHGELQPTIELLKRAGIPYHAIGGELWQFKDGKLCEQEDFVEDFDDLDKKFKQVENDMSVNEFIQKYLTDDKYEETRFTLRNYVEGYYAADASRASTLAMREELEQPEEDQYRIEGGYGRLMEFIAAQGKSAGVKFFLNTPVTSINWSKEIIHVGSQSSSFKTRKVLVTVPMGILQQEKITFTPAIPLYMDAAKELGYGPVTKTILQFKTKFWNDKSNTRSENLSKLGFLFSRLEIPTWWSQYPDKNPVLTGWSAGPHAEKLKGLSDEKIKDAAIASLAEIFGIGINFLHEELEGWQVVNWLADPYSLGAYSYEVVDGNRFKKILRTPLEERVYFAGEGLFEGPEIGTVNAALVLGRDTAHQMVAGFKK